MKERLAFGQIKIKTIKMISPEEKCQVAAKLRSTSWHAENVSTLSLSHAAICPQGCRNGGMCVAPGICSCPDGWLGGACHTGESTLPPNTQHYHTHQCSLQAGFPLSCFKLN